MSLEFTADFREFTNDFLRTLLDIVSTDLSDGSILQEVDSGRDGSGGVTFVPCTDANGFNYELFIGKQLDAQATRIAGQYVDQDGNTQGTLGGRLLTLVDSTETVFGATVQVAINIMDDNTLQVTRATAASTGIVLRGVDQGGDSQMTLLGASSGTLSGAEYIEIKVVHHPTTGSIEVWVDNVAFWSLANVNTAISGANQSTLVLWGGYGVTGLSDDTLHHEDLAAIISDVVVINGTVNVDDPNDPTDRIGDHQPLLSLPTADANYAQYSPDPSTDHFANVDEIPPDGDTSQNSAADIDQRDNFTMQDVAGTGTNQVYLAYTGYVRADTPAECGVSDSPATFEAFVYTEQTDPGEVHTTAPTGAPCNLSDFVSGRAQTTCTIAQDGEKVTFKPLTVSPVNTDAYFVGLSPLNAPPRLQSPQAPGYYAAAGFHPKTPIDGGFTLAANVNTTAIPGRVSYDLPWYQPWLGVASDDQDSLELAGDFFEFDLLDDGIGVDVGFASNADIAAPFNPYTTPLIAFHFREDIEGSPYFWISASFGYAGETIYTHAPGDRYRLVRNDPNIELYQNASLLETFVTGGLPTIVNPYVFVGRWGFISPFGYIRQPGIKNAFVQVASNDCCPASYDYALLSGSFTSNAPECQQWGVKFNASFADAFIYDPGSTHGPFPAFEYDADTRLEYSLESGNVVLRIYDPVSLSSIPDVAGVGTWTYTIPYANTDDFALQGSPPGVGPPDFPDDTLEYDFPTPGANAPLRLAFIRGADNGGVSQGLTDVSFTFITGVSPSTFTGFMRQDAADRSGTTTEAPTGNYAYRQSFLSSTPADTPITLDDCNEGTHGYTDPEP